jgi:prepilin-type N-terminal cleavage/methylation domain-containing protein
MRLPACHKRRPRPRHGFSLIELLAVIAIMTIVATFVVPAMGGFGRSAGLTVGGNQVVNLANYARQQAISKNTLTALVLLGNQGMEEDYRALTVLEYEAGFGWQQIMEWTVLPTGIVVDFSDPTNCTFLADSPQPFPFLTGPPAQQNPPVSHRGRDVAGYAARIFLPSGALLNSERPAQIRLVEGTTQGPQLIYTHPHASQPGPANFYDIAILGPTGLPKVSRP